MTRFVSIEEKEGNPKTLATVAFRPADSHDPVYCFFIKFRGKVRCF